MQKQRSTGPSRVVPHRSTTPARTCLTSLFGWEAVSQADVAALNLKEENQYGLTFSIPSIIACTRIQIGAPICRRLRARCRRHVSAPLWQREGRHEPRFPETSAIASPISGEE